MKPTTATVLRFVLGCLCAAVASATRSAAAGVSGRVLNEAGEPIAGATIFVYTAAPKTGASSLCPSCYADCGKTAKSDAKGRFTFASLAADLVFRLLAVAPGHTPKFVPGVEAGSIDLAVELGLRRGADSANTQTFRGRVLNANGRPVFGALLEISGADFGERRQFGGLKDTDPLAVSNENGEFVVVSGMRPLGLLGRVSARGLANQTMHLVTSEPNVLRLTEGAFLKGRVMADGKPVPQVLVGVSPQNRAAGSFVGDFQIGTDAEGRFLLPNLPPKTDYMIYGKMESVGRYGAIPARPVHVGRDGEVTDLGDLRLVASNRLSGRVILEDAGKLPENTQLLLAQDRVGDRLSVKLGPDGEFDVPGIPSGVVTLHLRVPGYQLSAKNRSYDPRNRSIIGRVETDIVGLQVLMEKGSPPSGPISVASLPRTKAGEHPREHPLRGAEPATP